MLLLIDSLTAIVLGLQASEMIRSVLPLVLVSILLVSCLAPTLQVGSSGRYQVTREAVSGEGYLMFSFLASGHHEKIESNMYKGGPDEVGFAYNRYTLRYRSVEEYPRIEEVGVSSLLAGYIERDFSVRKGFGVLICQPIPAGEYEIYGYALAQTKAYAADKTWEAFLPEPIRFEVDEQGVTYLGQIFAHHQFRLTKAGVAEPDGVEFTSHDEYDRDMSMAYNRWSYIIGVPVRNDWLDKVIARLNVKAIQTSGAAVEY